MWDILIAIVVMFINGFTLGWAMANYYTTKKFCEILRKETL